MSGESDNRKRTNVNRRGRGESMAHRPCLWACSVCNYLKNKDRATVCEMCGSRAPRTRFGIKVEGRHYLCTVSKAMNHENDSLVLLDTCPQEGATLKIHLTLDPSTEDLDERVERTLASFRKHFQLIVWGQEPQSKKQQQQQERLQEQQVPLQQQTQGLSTTNFAASRRRRKTQKALANIEVASSPTAGGAGAAAISPSGVTGELSNLLAALASPYTEDGKEKGTKDESQRPQAPVIAGTTLFDKVVSECRSQVYDTVLGTFLPKDHPSVRAAASEPGGPASHLFYGLETDFNFVKGMVKERDAMAHKVVSEAKLRRTVGVGSLQAALRPVEEEEQDKPRKLRLEVMYADSQLHRDFSVPCSLCERRYHPKNLVGVVPFRAVARWKEDHLVPVDPNDRRLKLDYIYDDTRLCVFCTQFFDTDFADFFCYHRGKTDLRDTALLMEGNREGTNINSKVSLALQEFVKSPRPADDTFFRPYSRLSLSMNLLQLRFRKDMPMRMAEVGCELARYSTLQHQIHKGRQLTAVHLLKTQLSKSSKVKGVSASARLFHQSQRLQADQKQSGFAPVVFAESLRKAKDKKAAEWSVASLHTKHSVQKPKRPLPSILAGKDAPLPIQARGNNKSSNKKKRSKRKKQQSTKQVGYKDMYLDDDDTDHHDAHLQSHEAKPREVGGDDGAASEKKRPRPTHVEGGGNGSKKSVIIIKRGHSYHDDNVRAAKKVYV